MLYGKILAKRLVHGQCRIDHAERYFIGKLQSAYRGSGALIQMIADLDTAEDLQRKFDRQLKEDDSPTEPKFTIAFTALSQAHWPLHLPSIAFHAPKDLLDANASFDAFYREEHPNRGLFCLWQHCHGELKMQQR